MKICIIGSGLTALVLAKSLINKNIHIDLIYNKIQVSNNSTRTIGISNKNLKFLKSLFPKVDKIGHNINQIKIFKDIDIKNEILNFDKKDKSQFFIFKYDKILKVIQKNIINEKRIKKISLNMSLDRKLKKKEDYNLIIDTEVKNKISKKFFFRKIKKDYSSDAYTTIIKHKKTNNSTARQIFTKFGPLAFLPISDIKTSIVFSINKKNCKLKSKNFYNLVKGYNNFYEINKFIGFEYFKLNLSLLKNYYYENILAFGESAHAIHPLAGQGFNMSLRDINCLSNIINKKIQSGLSLDNSIFDEFEKKSKYKNFLFANGIDFIYEFFNFEKKIPLKISKRIFKTLNQSTLIKNLSMRLADEGL